MNIYIDAACMYLFGKLFILITLYRKKKRKKKVGYDIDLRERDREIDR